jgi:aldehyde oxidoreductase
VAVAADTREHAEAALEKVQVQLEALPALSDPEAAMAGTAVQLYAEFPNVCFDQPQIKGDAHAALRQSGGVIEARFKTQINHQAPLEPEATIAYWEKDDAGGDDQLVIIGRSINIHYHLGMLQTPWLGELRYIEYSGGQFGIKIDVISEGIAGAAAIHFKRPVRYIPSLAESMLMTSKRHAFDMQVKLAADLCHLTASATTFWWTTGPATPSAGGDRPCSCCRLIQYPQRRPRRRVYTTTPRAARRGSTAAGHCLECTWTCFRTSSAWIVRLPAAGLLEAGSGKSTGEWCSGPSRLMKPCAPLPASVKRRGLPVRQGEARRGLGTGAFGIGMLGDTSVAAVELDPDGHQCLTAAGGPGESNGSHADPAHGQFRNLDRVRLHARHRQRRGQHPAAGSGHYIIETH